MIKQPISANRESVGRGTNEYPLNERIFQHFTTAKQMETQKGKHTTPRIVPEQRFNQAIRTIAHIGTRHLAPLTVSETN
jgi:hypothetical protein